MKKVVFLGAGNAISQDLGNSSAVVEIDADHQLVIDFGFTSLAQFKNYYSSLPRAVFITHTHLDHIGGLESLFYDARFNSDGLIKLFVPAEIVPLLHSRLATQPNILAEGGANFWDVFQLVPVSQSFWYADIKFSVFENRHHAPGYSFGICVPGYFLYSGDTKPIPEVILHHAPNSEIIFHDVSLCPQPSHTFIDELDSYPESIRKRMKLYHLGSQCQVQRMRELGYQCVEPGQVFYFSSGEGSEVQKKNKSADIAALTG